MLLIESAKQKAERIGREIFKVRMDNYRRVKSKHPESIILLRDEDRYVTYADDAVAVSSICGSALEIREPNTKRQVEQTTFRSEALNTYIPALVRAGRRIAICEQLIDPRQR